MTLLMPYVTGGVTPNWIEYAYAYQDAGADLIEVGLPFSDPMLDGVTIQRASEQALARGATPGSILAELAAARLRVPVLIAARTPTWRSGPLSSPGRWPRGRPG